MNAHARITTFSDANETFSALKNVTFPSSLAAETLLGDMIRSASHNGYASLRYAGFLFGLPNRNDTDLFGWSTETLHSTIIRRTHFRDSWEIDWDAPEPIPAVPSEIVETRHGVLTAEEAGPDSMCTPQNLMHEARDLLGDLEGVDDKVHAGVIHLVANVFSWGYEEARDKIMATETPDHPIDAKAKRFREIREELFEMFPEDDEMTIRRGDLPRHPNLEFISHPPVNTFAEPDSSTDEMDPPEQGDYRFNLEAILSRAALFYKAETYSDQDVMQNYGIEMLVQALTGEDLQDVKEALEQRANPRD